MAGGFPRDQDKRIADCDFRNNNVTRSIGRELFLRWNGSKRAGISREADVRGAISDVSLDRRDPRRKEVEKIRDRGEAAWEKRMSPRRDPSVPSNEWKIRR